MKHYLFCSPDGTILRTGSCPELMLSAMTPEAGEILLLVPHPVSDAESYVDLADPESPVVRRKPPPPSPFHVWRKGGWVGNLDGARLAKNTELSAACRTAIEAEFVSDALGTPHRYDYQAHDQQNLLDANIMRSGILISCTDTAGVKKLREHRADQVATLYQAGVAHRAACLGRLAALRSKLEGAEFPDVLAISWQGD